MSHVMHADKVYMSVHYTRVLKVIRNRKKNKEEYVKASIKQQEALEQEGPSYGAGEF